MATAKRLPSGHYRVRAYVGPEWGDKKGYKSFTAPTKAKAEKAASDFLYAHAGVAGAVSFQQAMDIFMKSRETTLSVTTYRAYVGIQRTLEDRFPYFCGLDVHSIRADNINGIINDLVERGRSPKTVRNYVGYIAVVLGSQQVRMPNGIHLPAKVRPGLYIPTEAEVKEILLLSKGSELELPVRLAISVPARRGEICGITADDLNGNMLHIHRSVGKDKDCKWHEKAPKTYSSDRWVSIPPDLADAIREKGCATTLTPDSLTEKFIRLLQRHNMNHFRFHDLRHFAVSYLHAQGVPDAYIQKRGGWSTDRVMKQVYLQTLQEEEKRSDEIVNEALLHLF